MSPPPTDVHALVAAYEDLRRQVLAGGRGPGLTVLLCHGMREWMEVCAPYTDAVAPATPAQAVVNTPLLPPATRSEVVAILAAMILENQREVTS